MRRIAFIAGVVLAAGALQAGLPDVRQIKSAADLTGHTQIGSGRDWSFEIGYGGTWKSEGPWVVLYCRAKCENGDQPKLPNAKGDGETLGPVTVRVTWDGDEKRATENKEKKAETGQKIGAEDLYAITVPLGRKGTCRIDVVNADGNVTAVGRIDVDAEPKLYWHCFAYPGSFASKTFAVYPKMDGKKGLLAQAAEKKKDDLPAEYPGDEKACMLKISLDDDAYLIESQGPKLQAPGYYMARWWVNGKAIEAQVEKNQLFENYGIHVENRMNERVAFGLPETLGEIKAGDTVGLQLLYSPDGVRQFPGTDHVNMIGLQADVKASAVPLLSQKLEFKVTEELLKKAGERKERKEMPTQREP